MNFRYFLLFGWFILGCIGLIHDFTKIGQPSHFRHSFATCTSDGFIYECEETPVRIEYFVFLYLIVSDYLLRFLISGIEKNKKVKLLDSISYAFMICVSIVCLVIYRINNVYYFVTEIFPWIPYHPGTIVYEYQSDVVNYGLIFFIFLIIPFLQYLKYCYLGHLQKRDTKEFSSRELGD